jgi:hypothetical protein
MLPYVENRMKIEHWHDMQKAEALTQKQKIMFAFSLSFRTEGLIGVRL